MAAANIPFRAHDFVERWLSDAGTLGPEKDQMQHSSTKNEAWKPEQGHADVSLAWRAVKTGQPEDSSRNKWASRNWPASRGPDGKKLLKLDHESLQKRRRHQKNITPLPSKSSPQIILSPELRPSSQSRLEGSSVGDHASRTLRPFKHLDEDPNEKYVRRKRHKTKDDKYDYKGEQTTKSESKEEDPRRRSRRSRRKKSGVALKHDFKAPNVEQYRLTLKARSGVGIFNKGKASEPFTWRDLPVLTFSEMASLRKPRPSEGGPSLALAEANPVYKKTSSTHSISSFFSHRSDSHQREDIGKCQCELFFTPIKASARSSPANLDTSRVSSALSGDSASVCTQFLRRAEPYISEQNWVSDANLSVLQHYQPAKADNQHAMDSNWSTRTCATPPASPSRPRNAPTRDNRGGHSQNQAVTMRGQNTQPRDLAHGESCDTPWPPHESSVSARSHKNYTEDPPISQLDNPRPDYVPLADPSPYYSLEDLKDLAKISQLASDDFAKDTGISRHLQTTPQHLRARTDLGITKQRRRTSELDLIPTSLKHSSLLGPSILGTQRLGRTATDNLSATDKLSELQPMRLNQSHQTSPNQNLAQPPCKITPDQARWILQGAAPTPSSHQAPQMQHGCSSCWNASIDNPEKRSASYITSMPRWPRMNTARFGQNRPVLAAHGTAITGRSLPIAIPDVFSRQHHSKMDGYNANMTRGGSYDQEVTILDPHVNIVASTQNFIKTLHAEPADSVLYMQDTRTETAMLTLNAEQPGRLVALWHRRRDVLGDF